MPTGQVESDLRVVKVGYPPFPLVNVRGDMLLSELPLKDGETILLENPLLVPERKVDYPICFVKNIPDDNSCLFNSIGYVLESRSLSRADSLRQCSSC